MNQREIWENIAPEWQKYRTTPKKEAIEFLQNKKGLVLDLCCANGRNFAKIDGTLVGLDFSKKMLAYAKKRAKQENIDALFVLADAADALPFKDNMFDYIMFESALASIKLNRHRKILEEIARISKNKAGIFISVWNKDQPRFANTRKESIIPWHTKGEKYDRYYYLYSIDELEALMKKIFSSVHVFGSEDGEFSKNLIATAKVSK